VEGQGDSETGPYGYFSFKLSLLLIIIILWKLYMIILLSWYRRMQAVEEAIILADN
jgi:hypothetical protein